MDFYGCGRGGRGGRMFETKEAEKVIIIYIVVFI